MLDEQALENEASTVTFTVQDRPYTKEEARIEFRKQIRQLWRLFQYVNNPTNFCPFKSGEMKLEGLDPLLENRGEYCFDMFLQEIHDCHFLCNEGMITTNYSQNLVKILFGLHDKLIKLHLVKVTIPANPGDEGVVAFTKYDVGKNEFLISKPMTLHSKQTVFFFLRWYGSELLPGTRKSSDDLWNLIDKSKIWDESKDLAT